MSDHRTAPGSIYSTAFIHPKYTTTPHAERLLFDYQPGADLPLAAGFPAGSGYADSHHTNLCRPGMSGLPQDWEGLVTYWFARVSLAHGPIADDNDGTLARAYRQWLRETVAIFRYNRITQLEARLEDLILPPDYAAPQTGLPPLGKTAAPDEVADALRRLVAAPSPVHLQSNLGFNVRLTSSHASWPRLMDALAAAEDAITVTVHLGGHWKRVVV
jgi:hypothetical protein